MKKPWIAVVAVLALAVAIIGGDQLLRIHVENEITQQIESQHGGDARVRLGGWPFALAGLTKRLPDAQVSVVDAEVANEDRKATVERVDIAVTGLSPINDLGQASVEQLDATASITWNQLSVLLGFPISRVQGDRVSAKTSVEVLQRVIPIELQAELSLQADGALVLSDPSVALADYTLPLPSTVVQLALDQLAPDLQLPTPAGLSYQGLSIGQDTISVRLTGQNVAVGDFV
nr:DUF2993 domain-containing protein [Propionicimonas sp.]